MDLSSSSSAQLDQIISLLTELNNLLAQLNVSFLWLLGVGSALVVSLVLYNFIKRFII